MRPWMAVLPLSLAMTACNRQPDWMPLETGKSWSYNVRADFASYPESVKVVRQSAVAGNPGFELQGPMGMATMAWVGKRLVAERLGVSRFDPPLPLLVPEAKVNVSWSGKILRLSGPVTGTGTLTQVAETISVDGKSFKTTRSTMKIVAAGHSIELVTWFSQGVGIVKQEQLTDGRQNLSLEIISGPA